MATTGGRWGGGEEEQEEQEELARVVLPSQLCPLFRQPPITTTTTTKQAKTHGSIGCLDFILVWVEGRNRSQGCRRNGEIVQNEVMPFLDIDEIIRDSQESKDKTDQKIPSFANMGEKGKWMKEEEEKDTNSFCRKDCLAFRRLASEVCQGLSSHSILSLKAIYVLHLTTVHSMEEVFHEANVIARSHKMLTVQPKDLRSALAVIPSPRQEHWKRERDAEMDLVSPCAKRRRIDFPPGLKLDAGLGSCAMTAGKTDTKKEG